MLSIKKRLPLDLQLRSVAVYVDYMNLVLSNYLHNNYFNNEKYIIAEYFKIFYYHHHRTRAAVCITKHDC